MNCSDATGVQGIESNPDLIGIGVRIAIYIQVLLPIFPQTVTLAAPGNRGKPNDQIATSGLISSGAILITGYAMIFSAIIQARTTHLTVYHALLTLNLNWLISLTSTDLFYFFGDVIPVFPKEPKEIRPVKKLSSDSQVICFLVLVAAGLHLSLTSALGVWLFINPARFDRLTPGCTEITVLSMFNINFPMHKESFRIAWLIIYCICLFPFFNIILLYLFLSALWFFAFQIWWQGVILLVVMLWTRFMSDTFREAYSQYWTQISRHVHPPKTIVIFTGAKVLFILSTEFTIRHNEVQAGEGDWTFGQTLSLFLTLPIIFKAFSDVGVAWRSRKKPMDLLIHWPPAVKPTCNASELPEQAVPVDNALFEGALKRDLKEIYQIKMARQSPASRSRQRVP